MNLAFVDNFSVRGGISRFSLLLCKNLVDNFPDLNVDYFIHYENLKYTPEVKELGNRVNILLLETTKPKSIPRKILQKLLPKFAGTSYHYDELMREIQTRVTTKYDLAYFPSAHMMKRPELK